MLSRWEFSLLSLALLSMIIMGCVGTAPGPEAELDFAIPEQSEWVDYGTIFEAGDEGEWDNLLWGGFTGTAYCIFLVTSMVWRDFDLEIWSEPTLTGPEKR